MSYLSRHLNSTKRMSKNAPLKKSALVQHHQQKNFDNEPTLPVPEGHHPSKHHINDVFDFKDKSIPNQALKQFATRSTSIAGFLEDFGNYPRGSSEHTDAEVQTKQSTFSITRDVGSNSILKNNQWSEERRQRGNGEHQKVGRKRDSVPSGRKAKYSECTYEYFRYEDVYDILVALQFVALSGVATSVLFIPMMRSFFLIKGVSGALATIFLVLTLTFGIRLFLGKLPCSYVSLGIIMTFLGLDLKYDFNTETVMSSLYQPDTMWNKAIQIFGWEGDKVKNGQYSVFSSDILRVVSFGVAMIPAAYCFTKCKLKIFSHEKMTMIGCWFSNVLGMIILTSTLVLDQVSKDFHVVLCELWWNTSIMLMCWAVLYVFQRLYFHQKLGLSWTVTIRAAMEIFTAFAQIAITSRYIRLAHSDFDFQKCLSEGFPNPRKYINWLGPSYTAAIGSIAQCFPPLLYSLSSCTWEGLSNFK